MDQNNFDGAPGGGGGVTSCLCGGLWEGALIEEGGK